LPRYHFHVQDGVHVPDREGSELADVAAARAEAVRLLGELLQDRPGEFWNSGHLAVIVESEGATRFVLRAAAEVGPEQEMSTAHRDE
jgi:hypothetical protein